jgi:hypothetical protein
MLGNYQVRFNFDETVVLQPGYERREPKRSAAFEHVLLVEDTGKRISLQHILVMGGGSVTKHWRQDWIYESPRHWVFVGKERFEPREREAAAIPGTWTQLVYEVNDAPRYAGDGKWNHKYGVSTWTSGRSWRPLPRREYTKRDDYQLINGENRHTITPLGARAGQYQGSAHGKRQRHPLGAGVWFQRVPPHPGLRLRACLHLLAVDFPLLGSGAQPLG